MYRQVKKLKPHWLLSIPNRGLNVYRQNLTTKRWWFVRSLLTQPTPHLLQIVSSETEYKWSKKRVQGDEKLQHLVFLKLQKNRYCWSFHIAHRMSSWLNDSWQSSINSSTTSFKWLLNKYLSKLNIHFLSEIRTSPNAPNL